jgi:hypothetical protein
MTNIRRHGGDRSGGSGRSAPQAATPKRGSAGAGVRAEYVAAAVALAELFHEDMQPNVTFEDASDLNQRMIDAHERFAAARAAKEVE